MKQVATVDVTQENGKCQETLFTCNVSYISPLLCCKCYDADHILFIAAFTMEQDIPDYDMDSDDERWINSQAGKLDITPLQVC